MNRVFIEVLNNGLTTSILILAVIVTRLLIKKAPKWLTCALWGLVALRLVFPFHMESALSLMPDERTIPVDIEYFKASQIEPGLPIVNQAANPVLEPGFTPQPATSVNLMQIVVSVAEVVWLVGILVLCIYSFAAYFVLKKKVSASQRSFKNVYVCDEVDSPFILGIIRPQIYLPSGMSPETKECVLEHERAHLKRLDHLWKPLGFAILSVYWFNPLCWIAYALLCKDIELACDEKVTKDKDKNWKAAYCQALLDCNAQKRMIAACPVSFGELSVKDRVKAVLNYKKPAFWMIFAAIAACIIVTVCFMTKPKEKSDALAEDTSENNSVIPVFNSENPTSSESDNNLQEQVYAKGTFDNVMGYSGYYIYYDRHPVEGYYYADDGTLLAHVWGTVPEDVGLVDLNRDGKNELISNLVYGDGGTEVIVYSEFEDGIRYGSVSDCFDEPYDNVGVGSLETEYLKESNEVRFSYWIEAEQKYKRITEPIDYYGLTWWTPDWLASSSQTDVEATASDSTFAWGDQRDWPCGSISEITSGTKNETEFTISRKHFISVDDAQMIEKLGLNSDDFPNGYAIVPIGETQTYPVDETCEFIFIDWKHSFDNDNRVSVYDQTHLTTKDYAVFKEYLDEYTSLNHQVFFYDINDGRITTVYETWLP